jgi:hypothetical protein
MSGFFRYDQMRILASYEHANPLAQSHVLGIGDTSPRLAGSSNSNRYTKSGRSRTVVANIIPRKCVY